MMDVDPERLGRIVSLSDYFADEELLRALLSDSVIRTAIARLGIARMPQRTSEIPSCSQRGNMSWGIAALSYVLTILLGLSSIILRTGT
jgi:hypothetical protein